MHYSLCSLFLLGLNFVQAQEVPKDVDLDVVLDIDPVPDPTIPVVYVTSDGGPTATAFTATYASSAAIAAVSAAVQDNSTDVVSIDTQTTGNARRRMRRGTTTCVTQPTGYGPVVSPDTPSAFIANTDMAAAATNAATPSGYQKTFTNNQASNNAYGYMGFTTLKSYNTQLCADKCTAIDGCQAFNLYFERDPKVNPDSSDCDNPYSTTQIKCVFWGGPVSAENALNKGQYRRSFQVVITGSNGYVNTSIETPTGYSTPRYYGKAAISAPSDCNGDAGAITTVPIQAQTFDIDLCAAACDAQAASGAQRVCRFFDTHILYKDGKSLGQMCALYDQVYDASYATNRGYSASGSTYTIGFSYTSYNVARNNVPYVCPAPSAVDTCRNGGLQWAWFSDGQESYSDNDELNFDITGHKRDSPQATGTTSYLHYSRSDENVYGNGDLDAFHFVIEHRGYIYAPYTGTYTFALSNVDDLANTWIGPNAYSGWTKSNSDQFADFEYNGYTNGQNTITKTLTAKQYYPFRLVYKQGLGGASFDYTITDPKGNVVIGNSAQSNGSPYVVQYSCDGTSAPAFPAFGQET